MAEQFQSPVGLRRWRQDADTEQREGYDLVLLEDCENAYRLTSIASATKIPQLIKTFCRFFPEEAFFILEYYPTTENPMSSRSSSPDDRPTPEVFYSPYLPIGEILGHLNPYLERMIHDGFIGFGLANNRAGLEIFYSEEKVLTFFTDNHLRLSDFLTRNQIPYDPELCLPSDFGHDHLSLLGLPRDQLPAALSELDDSDLDSLNFCQHLVEQFEMYPVEEGLSFFLTRKEQSLVSDIMVKNHYEELAGLEFGGLLLDWSEFVAECENGFEGDLLEYRQMLRIRDCIQHVIERVTDPLAEKITNIIAESDNGFRNILTARSKRIDTPSRPDLCRDHFWYQGVVRNHGTLLRRDLIRKGWFGN